MTEKVKVAMKSGDWSDFVFDKNYRLRRLEEIDCYIQQYKHLPDVPSAAEIEKSGIDVGKMDALLLQKIEELTLYLIQLKKENEAIKAKLAALGR